jgi:hypothetical protein
MISNRTRLLLVSAVLCSGILAGGIVDRALVAAPAWRVLGAAAWAQYSLQADLGTGLVAYPFEGIGAFLLAISAAVSYRLDRPAGQPAGKLLYLAAAFSLCGLLLTIKAAPIMLALGQDPSPTALAHAFTEFHFWGLYLRGTADMLAFALEITALATLR